VGDRPRLLVKRRRGEGNVGSTAKKKGNILILRRGGGEEKLNRLLAAEAGELRRLVEEGSVWAQVSRERGGRSPGA